MFWYKLLNFENWRKACLLNEKISKYEKKSRVERLKKKRSGWAFLRITRTFMLLDFGD